MSLQIHLCRVHVSALFVCYRLLLFGLKSLGDSSDKDKLAQCESIVYEYRTTFPVEAINEKVDTK